MHKYSGYLLKAGTQGWVINTIKFTTLGVKKYSKALFAFPTIHGEAETEKISRTRATPPPPPPLFLKTDRYAKSDSEYKALKYEAVKFSTINSCNIY